MPGSEPSRSACHDVDQRGLDRWRSPVRARYLRQRFAGYLASRLPGVGETRRETQSRDRSCLLADVPESCIRVEALPILPGTSIPYTTDMWRHHQAAAPLRMTGDVETLHAACSATGR